MKQIQITLFDDEYEVIAEKAREYGMSVDGLLLKAAVETGRPVPKREWRAPPGRTWQEIADAADLRGGDPSPDIDQMLREIEAGYEGKFLV